MIVDVSTSEPQGLGLGNCTLSTCPVTQSTYGYAPSLVANWLFFAIFLLSSQILLFQIFMYRQWRMYSLALTAGCFLEAAAYVARVVLHYDPFSYVGFTMDLVLLSIAPATICAGLYLLFVELALTFNPHLTVLKPKRHTQTKGYAYAFIVGDVISIVMQCVGGALSATSESTDTARMGQYLLIAGLAHQILTLAVFGALCIHYFVTLVQCHDKLDRNDAEYVFPASMALWTQRRFKAFLIAVTIAYCLILMRCCYRLAELQGGWGNAIMRNESLFIGLDSIAIAVAVTCLVAYHPGRCLTLLGINQNLLHDVSRNTLSRTSSTTTPSSSIKCADMATEISEPSRNVKVPVIREISPLEPSSFFEPEKNSPQDPVMTETPPMSSAVDRIKGWFRPRSGLADLKTSNNSSSTSPTSRSPNGSKTRSPVSALSKTTSPSYPFPRMQDFPLPPTAGAPLIQAPTQRGVQENNFSRPQFLPRASSYYKSNDADLALTPQTLEREILQLATPTPTPGRTPDRLNVIATPMTAAALKGRTSRVYSGVGTGKPPTTQSGWI